MSDLESLFCMKVVTDRYLTETVTVEHDGHRFIEYGSEDYSWRSYFGFITHRQVPSRKAYRLGDKIVMHPTLADELSAAVTAADTLARGIR